MDLFVFQWQLLFGIMGAIVVVSLLVTALGRP